MKRRISNYLIFLLAVTSLQMLPSAIPATYAATEIATSTDGTTASACNQDVGTPDSVTVVRIGGDCIITFVGSSTWNIPSGITSLRYLIVGGGGAGGAAGGNDGSGGGGAGGFLTGTISSPASTNGTVVVGNGGAKYASSATNHNPANFNGGNSSFSGTGITTITANGGGSGSSESTITRTAQNGGSGGGGGGYSGTRGTGTSGQGNDGGSTSGPGDGGGGGAGAKGGNGNSSSSDGTPRRSGGIGKLSDISGVNKYYAGGGGASGDARNSDGSAGGAGGLGGGGNGADATSFSSPTNGEPNTGGGGGGAAGTNPVGSVKATGGGGSGVVIFRYTLNSNCSSVSDNLSQPGYVIEKFISVGSCTWNKPAGVTTADVLVVGGGGGGGRAANGSILLGNEAGGGGAGGFKESINITLNLSSYSIVVGAGGEPNVNGVGSSAFDMSVSGGGRGAYAIHTFTTSSGSGNTGGNGASGGGGMHNSTAGGTGIAGEGFAGGTPLTGSQGGGGGGASEAGNTDGAAFGGDGKVSAITGTTYAGGGSGTLGAGGTPEGGAGGGGVAASFNTLSVGGANNGAENTGSGGAGGFTNDGTKNAGSGGSGIVVIRYRLETSAFDSALSLNGSNQYAAASGAQVIPTSTNSTFSIEAWIKQPASRSNGVNYQILSQGNFSAQFYFKIYNGSLTFSRSGYLAENTCSVGIPTEQWTHVAIVVGNSSQSCYINGAPAGSFTQSSTTAIGTSFAVGQYVPGGGEYFLGEIDEVKIWNSSRSQTQIQSDLKTYGGTLSSGLVAYYDFNDQSNSTIFNRSSGGSSDFNLTTTGSPTISSSSIFETSTVQAYTVVKFMRNYLVSSGGYKFPDTSTSIQYLIVGGGGGGGGGFNGGGGGAGGYRESTTVVNTTSPISVVVGQGGNGAVVGYGPSNGDTSTIFGISSTGGGKGATEQQLMSGPYSGTSPDGTPSSGGSGGGGGHGASVIATWGTNLSGAPGNRSGYSPVEGFAGGNGNSTSTESCCYALAGGGGGGAGGAGGNAGSNGINGTPGAGGIGRTSFITGNALNLAGGGGGAGRYGNTSGPIVRGSSASFGGGAGAQNTSAEQNATFNGVNGSVNTGGGGGGGASTLTGTANGGNGGSGLIIVRYITSKPTILTQPTNDTTTVGTVDTFTISTSVAPAPLTKTVQWQFTADTTTGITGWTNLSIGSGFTTDTYTTTTLTKSMNKYRFRAIVTFSDTATIAVQETSSVVILTINDSITITSDTSTITRKYGDTQTVRTIVYSGGTTSTGALGTSTSHVVSRPFISSSNGKITLDTSTSTARLIIDSRTAVGTYYETITVTDSRSATSSYTQKVVVTEADTLTIRSGTPSTLTYTGAQAIFDETITVTGLVSGDIASGVTYTYSASAATCASGGLCNVGDIGPSGGYVFYVSPTVINVASGISTGGIYLEAAPVAAQGTAEYGCTGTNTPGTSYAVGSGAANTLAIINACATAGIAARVTSNLTYAGVSDWFMPSLDEMTAIYNNLYRNTPSLGGFTGIDYGSSSEGTNGNGYQAYWWFGSGAVSGQTNKNLSVAYRPVRAFNPIYTSAVNYGPSTTKPTGAGTYTITPSAVTFSDGTTSNYINIKYETSTLTINKAVQDSLTITSKFAPYNGGTSTMKLTTIGGTDTGTVTYAIVSGGSASGCSVSTNVLSFTSAGTCKVIATKAATLNYLITYSDTATITFSLFVSGQPIQTQQYPNQIPINGKNSLDTTTATIPDVTSVTATGAGAYTIVGTGFTGVNRVVIGGTAVTIASSTSSTINITGASGLTGPLIIECSDGRLGPVPFWLIL